MIWLWNFTLLLGSVYLIQWCDWSPWTLLVAMMLMGGAHIAREE